MAIPDVLRLNEVRLNRITDPAATLPPHSITAPAGDSSTLIATTEFVRRTFSQIEDLLIERATIGELDVDTLRVRLLIAQLGEIAALTANTITVQQITGSEGIFDDLYVTNLFTQNLSVEQNLRLSESSQVGQVWTAVDTNGLGQWQTLPPYLEFVTRDNSLVGDGRTSSPLGVNLSQLEQDLDFIRPDELIAGNNIQITPSNSTLVVSTTTDVTFVDTNTNNLTVGGQIRFGTSSTPGQVWTATNTNGTGQWQDLPNALLEVASDDTLFGTGRPNAPLGVSLATLNNQLDFLRPGDILAGNNIQVTINPNQQVVVSTQNVLTPQDLVAGTNVTITTNAQGQLVISAVPPVV